MVVTVKNPCSMAYSLSSYSHCITQEAHAAPDPRTIDHLLVPEFSSCGSTGTDCGRPALRILLAACANRTRVGKQIPRDSQRTKAARLHAVVECPSASRRFALRQAECRMDSREVQGVGTRRQDRKLQSALPYSQAPPPGTRCAHTLFRQTARA